MYKKSQSGVNSQCLAFLLIFVKKNLGKKKPPSKNLRQKSSLRKKNQMTQDSSSYPLEAVSKEVNEENKHQHNYRSPSPSIVWHFCWLNRSKNVQHMPQIVSLLSGCAETGYRVAPPSTTEGCRILELVWPQWKNLNQFGPSFWRKVMPAWFWGKSLFLTFVFTFWSYHIS